MALNAHEIIELFKCHEYAKVLDETRLEDASQNPRLLTLRARCYQLLGFTALAEAAYTRVCTISNDKDYVHNLAAFNLTLNRTTEVTSSLLGLLKNGAQIKGATFALLSRVATNENAEHIHTYLVKRLASESDPGELALLNHSSSKLKEVVKDYAEAYRAIEISNALQLERSKYTTASDQRLFDMIKAVEIEPLSLKLESNIKHIFIVGLPRSGTTVLEQMLANHSKIMTLGELDYLNHLQSNLPIKKNAVNSEAVALLRRNYLRLINTHSGVAENPDKIILDKMPLNLRWIKIIVAAFPDSKIIWVKRNPLETIFSNYTTYFPAEGLTFTNNLFDCENYYKYAKDFSEYLTENFAGRVLELRYEALLESPELEMARLTKELNLPMEQATLTPSSTRPVATASSLQVRDTLAKPGKPKWMRYEKHLPDNFKESLDGAIW